MGFKTNTTELVWPKKYTTLGYTYKLEAHLNLYAVYKDNVRVKSCLGTLGDCISWVKEQLKNET